MASTTLRCSSAFRRCLSSSWTVNRQLLRGFASTTSLRDANATTTANQGIPWFVDPEPVARRTPQSIPASRRQNAPPIPEDTPEVLRELHAQLLKSPHLDISQLVVTPAVAPPPGPELPERLPQGRRGRGGTYAGESIYDATSGLWSWYVYAQVKEGTEGRGAIDSVVRAVRKVLLERTPPVTLPPKSKRQMKTGWAMVDAGNFAVHILSKEAREKYFSDIIPR
ncbi:hypothetical protein CC1G_04295 [Coprinopsis cinerea okayama7|uniref:Uncharacterized protein n=1 Tax=Coprinopsis cinerea (strain Okayama-7 / 130 / ATCC MYA-4618 / FGSC 9003) TaxID=240176 RepID=A8NFL5_COPC7|nr:hypothetical protein CC1G_04295 [Coprinopsis cinerea okayama7\|eukprot:XP_001833316.1 hypothetical protein CC1G_04295 [Coprinopsis cinerea okayama7\